MQIKHASIQSPLTPTDDALRDIEVAITRPCRDANTTLTSNFSSTFLLYSVPPTVPLYKLSCIIENAELTKYLSNVSKRAGPRRRNSLNGYTDRIYCVYRSSFQRISSFHFLSVNGGFHSTDNGILLMDGLVVLFIPSTRM